MASAKGHDQVKIRDNVKNSLFAAQPELKDLQLPRYADIILYYYWLQNVKEEIRDIYLQTEDDIIKMIGEKVTEILIKASIPVVSKRTIDEKIKNYFNKCRSLEKSCNDTCVKNQTTRVDSVHNAKTSVFDIASCK